MALDWLCRVWGYGQGLGVFVVQGLGFRGLRGPGMQLLEATFGIQRNLGG